jgi:hypothetical protein
MVGAIAVIAVMVIAKVPFAPVIGSAGVVVKLDPQRDMPTLMVGVEISVWGCWG